MHGLWSKTVNKTRLYVFHPACAAEKAGRRILAPFPSPEPIMTRATRRQWLDAGLACLQYEGAAEFTSVRLARRLGVTRGSFYHHFPHWEAYIRAVLDEWEEACTRQVIAASEAATSPIEQLGVFLDVAAGKTPALDLAIRAWAQHHAIAREYVQRADRARLDYAIRLCRNVAGAEEAAFFGQVAYYAFLGLQQAALAPAGPGPEDFRRHFQRLFAVMMRLTYMGYRLPPG